MNQFAVLIFEFNCYEGDPMLEFRTRGGNGFKIGNVPRPAQASVWLHVTTDEQWKELIPADMETRCLRLCGPVADYEADNFIKKMQKWFDQLGVEHYEQACADD